MTMTTSTEYKVTRNGKVVLTGSYVVCRQEANTNGGQVSRTISFAEFNHVDVEKYDGIN
jgi:hypothetical protein